MVCQYLLIEAHCLTCANCVKNYQGVKNECRYDMRPVVGVGVGVAVGVVVAVAVAVSTGQPTWA